MVKFQTEVLRQLYVLGIYSTSANQEYKHLKYLYKVMFKEYRPLAYLLWKKVLHELVKNKQSDKGLSTSPSMIYALGMKRMRAKLA